MGKNGQKLSTRTRGFVASLAALWVLTNFAEPAFGRDMLVFAAASTADALNTVLGDYTEQTGVTVRASYASSGALARQIDHGAPAALFISANVAWVAWLDKRARLARRSRVPLFGNRLVLIEPKPEEIRNPVRPKSHFPIPLRHADNRDIRSNILRWHQDKIAIADPAHVPAGAYAKEALTSLGLWKTASKMAVRTRDVRGALLLVERGEAKLGVVYKSDAIQSSKVRILNTFPSDSHRPIRYHMAIIEEHDNGSTRRLHSFLQSLPAKAIFGRFGFNTRKYHGSVKSR